MGKTSRKGSSKSSKRTGFVAPPLKGKQSKAGSDINRFLKKYKEAGYGVSGTAKDGILIIQPRKGPDSFSMADLKKALRKT